MVQNKKGGRGDHPPCIANSTYLGCRLTTRLTTNKPKLKGVLEGVPSKEWVVYTRIRQKMEKKRWVSSQVKKKKASRTG